MGALVSLTIVLAERNDALWLPPDAIRRFQGDAFVLVLEGGRQRRVDIETGVESANQVEILEGLERGQVVVAP
jgi:hypothetical protein